MLEQSSIISLKQHLKRMIEKLRAEVSSREGISPLTFGIEVEHVLMHALKCASVSKNPVENRQEAMRLKMKVNAMMNSVLEEKDCAIDKREAQELDEQLAKFEKKKIDTTVFAKIINSAK
eukprot:TRINITY_DN7471_c0_g1_i2.p2 TRINITY_DN7471_c0_g1~~TRINITY_DN7471_c0_g1_i2.p2  ORF type:complete len:120 (+),score=31.51 TRINITY_DN7471_c0_g1_i2:240-599(+)